MPDIRLDSNDLLEYDVRYSVLICRACQYAIQKSALRSHLLRHKIYRDERQRLLSLIAQLDLLEPHDVPLPPPSSLPIDALPILSGYHCTATGCRYLCASHKRMKCHRNEIHGISGPSTSSFARSVKLQTFFRGTKIRYFEVSPSPQSDDVRSVLLSRNDDGEFDDEGCDEQASEADAAVQFPPAPPIQSAPSPSEIPSRSSPINLDLEMFKYFHHFTAVTSLTLPQAEHPQLVTQYWQTEVVLLALKRRWLLCGLLAISACHLAALTDETARKLVHHERSAQFVSEFSVGWQETLNSDLGMTVAGSEGDRAKKAGWYLRCILRCAYWALAESNLDLGIASEPNGSTQLKSIMATIRGFVAADLAFDSDAVWNYHDGCQGESFAEATRILKMKMPSNAGSFEAFSSCDNTHTAILECLHALPFRMVEIFGKPDNIQDVLATLSAIAALVECCNTSFKSNEIGEASWGMATWLTKIPRHFNHLVACHSPAALVVVAHWAASLVKRADYCGCWFLRGSAKKILLQITERLPKGNCAIQDLVGSLAV
ncbi:MAG: hypothetical protein M1820_006266 [Bogoriella megaspora]|nr:MAG: hypothetical protein M1820_006266 [Bogoriella megaspora]